ncbi:ring finger protein [Dorcoceras hygrometricum]|uniref:Ring finger protein n=1 Tax=Dorcoceras hygrometricum TaxID=472368 RepID=A0A2Z7CAD3_9LAMI|nr:ring finger protein [Dorcoceras hygrometricum]
MLGAGMNLITTIVGFGMSGTFIVFVCTRIICRRLRRMEEQRAFEADPRNDFELPEHGGSGRAPVVVAAIPTMKFNREAFSSMEDAQCSICLAEYEEKEVLRIMPKCGHTFHLSCIDMWLRKQLTCPICRISMDESFETKQGHTNTMSTAEYVDSSETVLDSSEITVEHSQQWLLPAIAHAVGNRSNHRTAGSVSIDIDSGVHGEGTFRS